MRSKPGTRRLRLRRASRLVGLGGAGVPVAPSPTRRRPLLPRLNLPRRSLRPPKWNRRKRKRNQRLPLLGLWKRRPRLSRCPRRGGRFLAIVNGRRGGRAGAARRARGEERTGAVPGGTEAPAEATGEPPRRTRSARRYRCLRRAERVAIAAPAGEPAEAFTSALPLTIIRKTIAEHMARSAGEIPAAWSMVEADVTGLVRVRDARAARSSCASTASRLPTCRSPPRPSRRPYSGIRC